MDHEGNPNNLLINTKLMRCFGIDQATCEIPKFLYPKEHEEYMKKVKTFIKAFKSDKEGKIDPINRICEMIKFYSDIEISNEFRQFIWKGMDETVQTILRFDYNDIYKLKKKVDQSFDSSVNVNVEINLGTNDRFGFRRIYTSNYM